MQPPRPAAANARRTSRLPRSARRLPVAARRPGRLRRPGLPRGRDGRHRRPRRGEQAGALPALPGQARSLPGAARGARLRARGPRRRGHGRHRRQPRAGRRRRGAYYDFIDAEGEAFRLVFESDLRNDADVRGIVDRGTQVCVEAIAEVIAADTGADPERALLLASGLTGLAETVPAGGCRARARCPATRRCPSCPPWPGAASRASHGSTASTRRPDRARSLTAHPPSRSGRGALD